MKKQSKLAEFLCLILCVIMVAGSMPVQPAKADEPKDVWYGDVNDDGKIDAKDVTMLRRQLAGGWNVNINEGKADLNQDNEINAKDVTMLRRFLAGGWGVELPLKPAKNTIEISTPNGTEILTEAEGHWNPTEFSNSSDKVFYTIPYVDAEGKIKKEIEINSKGEKTEKTYDDKGKVIFEDRYYKRYDSTIYDVLTYELIRECSYEYYPDGTVSKCSSDDGRYLKQDEEYDEAGRLVYIKSYYYDTGYESITKRTYNDNGILIKEEFYSVYKDQENSYGYKEIEWIKEYDDNGLFIRDKYLRKDFDDNLDEVVSENSGAEKVEVYCENGEKTKEQYYLKDILTKIVTYNADGTTEIWEAVLDDKGRVIEGKDNNFYQYDEKDRIVKKTIQNGADSTVSSFVYDSEDRIVSQTDTDYRDNGATLYSSLTTEYTYDADGHVLKTKENRYSSIWEETVITTKEFSGDEIVNKTVETKSNYTHKIEETEYVSTGRIEKITNLKKNTVTTYEYDTAGNIIRINGIKNTYDEKGRIVKLITEKYSYSEDKYIVKETPIEYTDEGSICIMEIKDYQDDDYFGGRFYSFDAATRTLKMYWETAGGSESYYCMYDDDWNLVKESKRYTGDFGNDVVLWYKDGKAVKLDINSGFNQVNYYTYSVEEKQPDTEMVLSLKGGVYVFDKDGRLISKLVNYWDDNLITDFYGSDGNRIKRLYNYHGKNGERCEVYFENGSEKKAVFTDKSGKIWEFEYVYDDDGRRIVEPLPAEYANSNIFVIEEKEYDLNGYSTKTKTTKIDNDYGLVEERYYIKGSSYDVDKVVCTDSNGITREYKCSYDSDGNTLVGIMSYNADWFGENGEESDIVYHIYEKVYNAQGKCVKHTQKDINHRTGDVLIARIDEYEYDDEGDMIKHTYITRDGVLHE